MREELLHFFNRNKDIAMKIVEKVTDTQQLRKELQEVKKLARERAKAITIRIPQLKDYKNHYDKAKGKGTMVDSARTLRNNRRDCTVSHFNAFSVCSTY